MTGPRDSIAGRRLALLTGIRYDTLRYTLRRPAPLNKSSEPRYAIAEVNAWLADAARGFAEPPTLSDLESGKLELITRAEAHRLVPRLSEVTILKRAHQGRIEWLKLSGGLVRYSKASVLKLDNHPPFYTTAETCRILCVR